MRQHHDVTAETEDKLDEALALLASGIPLETILADFGEDETWLRPLLEIAADVDAVQQNISIPPPDASLNKMLAHAETVRAAGASDPQPGWLAGLAALFGRGGTPLALGFRTAALAMSLIFAFLAGTVLGGSLTAAAHDSLPGQPYYGLKRAAENVRLSLTWSPMRREELVETYNHRRQMEAELLLEQGQTAAINFESVIQTVTGSTITLAGGLTVQMTADTDIEGDLAPGARIQIEAETQPPGSLQARAITVIEPAPPTPTPTATASPTPRPSATATRAQASDTLVLPSPNDLPDDAFEERDPDEPIDDEDDTNDRDSADEGDDDPDDVDDRQDDDRDNDNDDVDGEANENDDDLDNENDNDDFDDISNDNASDDLDDDTADDDVDDSGDDDFDDDFDDEGEDDLDDDFDDEDEDDLDDDFEDEDEDNVDDEFDDDSSDDNNDDENSSDSDDSSDDDEGGDDENEEDEEGGDDEDEEDEEDEEDDDD